MESKSESARVQRRTARRFVLMLAFIGLETILSGFTAADAVGCIANIGQALCNQKQGGSGGQSNQAQAAATNGGLPVANAGANLQAIGAQAGNILNPTAFPGVATPQITPGLLTTPITVGAPVAGLQPGLINPSTLGTGLPGGLISSGGGGITLAENTAALAPQGAAGGPTLQLSPSTPLITGPATSGTSISLPGQPILIPAASSYNGVSGLSSGIPPLTAGPLIVPAGNVAPPQAGIQVQLDPNPKIQPPPAAAPSILTVNGSTVGLQQ